MRRPGRRRCPAGPAHRSRRGSRESSTPRWRRSGGRAPSRRRSWPAPDRPCRWSRAAESRRRRPPPGSAARRRTGSRRRAAPTGAPPTGGPTHRGVGPDHDQPHVAAHDAHGLHQIVHALVAARRAQEHHHPFGADADPRPGRLAIVARRIPGLGVADVGDQRAAEAALQKARGDGDRIGAADQALHQPRPRQTVRDCRR